jgi:hypothetical protein
MRYKLCLDGMFELVRLLEFEDDEGDDEFGE